MLPDEYTADELESLIEAEKLDDIAEYYSGKTDDNDIKDETIAEGGIMSESGDENIHDSSNGLSDRAKKILSYCISGAVSLAVIAAAFVCALNMPKDEEVLNAAADALRAEDDYISLKNEYESVAAEAAALEESAAEKKELADVYKRQPPDRRLGYTLRNLFRLVCHRFRETCPDVYKRQFVYLVCNQNHFLPRLAV